MRLNNTIRTNDGVRIWINCDLPEKENGKVIVIAPGVGLTHDYYYLFANFFCQQGYVVISFDYRGVGKSAPQKLSGYEARMHQWAAQDINTVLIYAKQNYPGQEIIYIGHAIGGEIIGLAPASQYINRIVLVSSALTCSKLWPLRDKIRMRIIKTSAKILNKAFGYFPGKALRTYGDLPRGVVSEWANWCDNQNGLFDNFPDNNYRKLNIPILAYTFSNDWHCPPRAVKELLNRFANAMITWYHLDPKEIGMKKMGNHDFFLPAVRSTLWKHLLEWTNNDHVKTANTKPVIHKSI